MEEAEEGVGLGFLCYSGVEALLSCLAISGVLQRRHCFSVEPYCSMAIAYSQLCRAAKAYIAAAELLIAVGLSDSHM